MAEKTKITDATLDQVLQSSAVKQALAARARLMLPRAQGVASKAGAIAFSKRLRFEQGTRPGAKSGGFQRPYARISASIDDDLKAADKGSKLTRRQILRRAAS